MVDKYKAAHVEAQVAGPFPAGEADALRSTQLHLEQRIVPKWGDRRLCEINPDEVPAVAFRRPATPGT